MDDPYLIQGIIISLLFSAFFSGIEIAFVSADKLHIELQKDKSGLSGKTLASLIKRPGDFISTTLIGNTIALVFYGKYMADLLEPSIAYYSTNPVFVILVQTVVATLIVLATAEFLPKSLFLINPNRMLNIFAIPIQLIMWILYIPVRIVVYLTRLIIVNLFKGDFSDEKPVYGITDLNNYLSEIVNKRSSDPANMEVDTEILHNALEFKDVRIRDCLIPRIELVAIDIESSIKDLKKAFISSGHSKVLIYEESIDEVIGYCHSTTLFKKPKVIRDILQDIPIVPETMLANELLVRFTKENKHIALVVDEFGGTSGIVTIEDVIEEIFGEIQDEHDDEALTEHKIDNQTFVFSARHEIDYLNEKYNLNFPSGDYDTLGGLIFSAYGDIPRVNQEVVTSYALYTVKSMDGIKINQVKVELIEDGLLV